MRYFDMGPVRKQPFDQLTHCLVSISCSLDLAFPDDRNPPALVTKLGNVSPVSLLIGREFRCPEVGARGWRCREAAASVPVPVATVNEDDRTVARHDKVRSAWQILAMQPVAKTGSMQSSSHVQFRFRVRATDTAHHSRTGFWIYDVGHVN